ncbi:MAG TPA: helix-turn-helix domain-containing protein [Phycisphaerales bacterium]|nr:helix-turn-helix domain-containing protein [Phycisphaerales bacterium]
MKRPTKRTSKAVASKKRSACPIACTLDIVGDKWTLLVIRDLFAGKSHYHEFLQSPERIATNILAERLTRLTSAGLITAHASPQREGASLYQLTPRGQSLFPVLVAIRDWGLTNITGTKAHMHVPTPK